MIPRRRPLADCDRELIGMQDFAKSLPKGLAEKMHVWYQQELAFSQIRKERGEDPQTLQIRGLSPLPLSSHQTREQRRRQQAFGPFLRAQLREYGRAQYRSIHEVARMLSGEPLPAPAQRCLSIAGRVRSILSNRLNTDSCSYCVPDPLWSSRSFYSVRAGRRSVAAGNDSVTA